MVKIKSFQCICAYMFLKHTKFHKCIECTQVNIWNQITRVSGNELHDIQMINKMCTWYTSVTRKKNIHRNVWDLFKSITSMSWTGFKNFLYKDIAVQIHKLLILCHACNRSFLYPPRFLFKCGAVEKLMK